MAQDTPSQNSPNIEWKGTLEKFLRSTGSFDDRQIKEMMLAEVYENNFDHGTDGHSRLKLIARMLHFIDWMRLSAVAREAKDSGVMQIGGDIDFDNYLKWRAANSVPDPLR